jgi:hypothetical protein
LLNCIHDSGYESASRDNNAVGFTATPKAMNKKLMSEIPALIFTHPVYSI